MSEQIKQQEKIYDEIYSIDQEASYGYNFTKDALTRYLRDRRLYKALKVLANKNQNTVGWKVLSLCGGVGGEGVFFVNNGFEDVTVSDISDNSLKICNQFAPSIKTVKQNAESLDFPDNSFDIVVVQDGLHHLPRPVSGFTEMLRVAKKAVVVIEPYNGFIGKLIGTEWEVAGDAMNYVFRWNKNMVSQTVKSFLLKNYSSIKVIRCWDHGLLVSKIVGLLPKSLQLKAAKLIYAMLKPFNIVGNMMVTVVIK